MKNSKRLYILLIVVLITLFYYEGSNGQDVPAQPARRSFTQNRQRIISPEILPDNMVVFRLFAPKADTVKLVDDPVEFVPILYGIEKSPQVDCEFVPLTKISHPVDSLVRR